MTEQRMQKNRLQIEAALAGVEAELAKLANGVQSVSTKRELEIIAFWLHKMLESLDIGVKVETPGLAHLIVDTWQFDNRLSELIVKAEYDYRCMKWP
ncbi:MAG TPA: hypothetical protein VHI13_08220 [Candidatus Kapabacteria bacterium]|nr:hypothetical protein [Candidatus Kapabacteria bacterium]